MGERSSDPRLEAWLIIGHVAAPREPRPVQPLEGAEFEVDPAADFDLGDDHRRKPEPADLSGGDESLGFDGNVILAILQGRDLGVVPLVSEPLAVGQCVSLRPRDEALGRVGDGVAPIGMEDRMYATVRAGRSRILTLNPSGLCAAGNRPR